jgi:hypothetical protein
LSNPLRPYSTLRNPFATVTGNGANKEPNMTSSLSQEQLFIKKSVDPSELKSRLVVTHQSRRSDNNNIRESSTTSLLLESRKGYATQLAKRDKEKVRSYYKIFITYR